MDDLTQFCIEEAVSARLRIEEARSYREASAEVMEAPGGSHAAQEALEEARRWAMQGKRDPFEALG